MTFFDTAAIYGQGHNETLVGARSAPGADDIVLATKCGIIPASPGPGIDADGSAARRSRASCDESLQRLGTDVIDLLYLHRVDPKVPIEESVGALARPRARGQGASHRPVRGGARDDSSRAEGASDHGVAERVFALVPRAGNRMFCRCAASSASASSRSVRWGAGSCPAPVKDTRGARRRRRPSAIPPRFQGENLDRNLALIQRSRTMAGRKRCTPGTTRAHMAAGQEALTSCRFPAPSA